MGSCDPTLHPNLLVSEVMDRWPQTIQAFVQLHMACPGCAIARFHTLAEVAAEYEMDPQDLVGKLQKFIDRPQDRNASTAQDPPKNLQDKLKA